MNRSFHDCFVGLFDRHFPRLFRFLDRMCGDPDLAADLAQETFLRLFHRGSPPDRPEAWLITVATNLFRNARSTQARRTRILAAAPVEEPAMESSADPPQVADEGMQRRVRAALEQLSDRDRRLLLLRAEDYSYRDIAIALELNEASVGTLLARAKQAFIRHYETEADAPRG